MLLITCLSLKVHLRNFFKLPPPLLSGPLYELQIRGACCSKIKNPAVLGYTRCLAHQAFPSV